VIYESRNPRYAARSTATGKTVAFLPMASKPGELGFGSFDTALQGAALGGEADAIAFIESLPMFKQRRVGKAGIWRRTERVDAEQGAAKDASRQNTVADMTEPTLRGICVANNVAAPVGATIEQLRVIVVDVLSGRLASGSVAVVAPASPESTVLSPESPKTAPKPKKK